MANFSTANLVKAQAKLNAKFSSEEMRAKQPAAVLLANQNTNVLIPGHEELRTREDRPVEANILSRSKRANTAARVYNHTGNRGDSFVLPLNWATFGDKFSMSLKMLDTNVFQWDEVFAQQMMNAQLNIYENIETYLVAYLVANRTQINVATQGGVFNATNDAFEIAAGDKAVFYQLAKSMMRQNKYRGQYDVLASNATYVAGEFQANQGAGNNTNTGFQFSGLNIVESTELADTNYPNGVSLIMPAGTFGILPWIPKQNRKGDGDYNTYVGGFGSFADMLGLGWTFALHAYQQRADTTALNGSAQDVTLEFEISIDLAPVLPPLSTATESVVFEVAQK